MSFKTIHLSFAHKTITACHPTRHNAFEYIPGFIQI